MEKLPEFGCSPTSPLTISVSMTMTVLKNGREVPYDKNSFVFCDGLYYEVSKFIQASRTFVAMCTKLKVISNPTTDSFIKVRRCSDVLYLPVEQLSRPLVQYRTRHSDYVILNSV